MSVGVSSQKCVTQFWSLCVVGTLLHLPLVYLPHRRRLPVAAVSVLHCKASSTLNMSLLRLSHAKRWWGGERKRKRRGWKAPQETNPFSVRCLDANPQWKNVMSVCLHCVSPLLFCFRGSFILPLLLPHCFLQLFFFSLSALAIFSFFVPAHQFLPTSNP